MANPILNDKTWNKAARDPGWGAPDPSSRAGLPINDGPISPWRGSVMTVGGTIRSVGSRHSRSAASSSGSPV